MSQTDVYLKDIAFKSDFVLTASGDLDTIEGLENVKEALMRRLITSPGTVVHRPEYGVGIKDFQNSLNSLEKRRRLAARIAEQFVLDERVESVTGVSVNSDDNNPGMVSITVRVKLVGYDEQQMTFVPFGEA